MKSYYDQYMMRWKVDGLGWFDTREEARKAIRKFSKDATLQVRLKSYLKCELETLAEERGQSVSDLVRGLIEKEVNGNGNGKER